MPGDRRGGEGPEYSFVHALRRQHPLQVAHGALVCRQGDRGQIVGADKRRGRQGIEADDPQHFFDQIGRAVDIRAPGRDADPVAVDAKAQVGQDRRGLCGIHRHAAATLDQGEVEIDGLLPRRFGPGDVDFAGFTAAKIEDVLRRDFQTLDGGRAVRAALEAEAGVGVDAQLAPGAGNVGGVPECRLDQHVDRVFRTACVLTADDPAQRDHLVSVGDDGHGLIEAVFLVVERAQALSVPGGPYGEGAAGNLVGVEDVHGPVLIERHPVGDVDQRRDRLLAHGFELALEPVGGFAIPDVADNAVGEDRAVFGLDRHADRAGAAAALEARAIGAQAADLGGCKVPRHAAHAQAVRAVGGDVDLDHWVVDLAVVDVARADRRVFGQLDDAVVVVGDQ